MRIYILTALLGAFLLPMVTALVMPSQHKPDSGRKLSATTGVSQPLWYSDEARTQLTVQFGLVNDGADTTKPELTESRLFINGSEFDRQRWRAMLNNGLRPQNSAAIPPGKYVLFSMELGRYFEKPGVYKIQWKGRHFESDELQIRVERMRSLDRNGRDPSQPADSKKTIWAGISLPNCLHISNDAESHVRLEFSLLNETDKAANPDLDSSNLLINGQALNAWRSILDKAIGPEHRKAIKPGAALSFACDCDDYFTKPGLYRIQWKGNGFESPKVACRVILRK